MKYGVGGKEKTIYYWIRMISNMFWDNVFKISISYYNISKMISTTIELESIL
jgi:hypothetical protein